MKDDQWWIGYRYGRRLGFREGRANAWRMFVSLIIAVYFTIAAIGHFWGS